MEIEIIFVLIGVLVPRLNGKETTLDCICGELCGIGFVILLSYLVYGQYGWETFEPVRVGKFLILGYLPWRLLDWLF